MRVRVLHDGMAALRELLGDDHGPKPRLIILDLNLPGLDGMELLRCLTSNARTADIPVYMLSGSCSPEDVGASRSYGAKACMRKPCSLPDIRRVAEFVTRSLH
jgi:two-component system response regulator